MIDDLVGMDDPGVWQTEDAYVEPSDAATGWGTSPMDRLKPAMRMHNWLTRRLLTEDNPEIARPNG
jgi:hypothetical protein